LAVGTIRIQVSPTIHWTSFFPCSNRNNLGCENWGFDYPRPPGTRAELHIDLRSQGYEYVSASARGYVTYRHPDGRVVTVKPSGKLSLPARPSPALGKRTTNEQITPVIDCLIKVIQQVILSNHFRILDELFMVGC
jgi:hypothetical protein